MKILQINTVYPHTSVGRICKGIHDACIREGMECQTAYRFREGEEPPESFCTTSWLDGHIHNRLAWITGLQGFFSYFHTLRFVSRIRQFKPDLIQLHNIHGSYLNWSVLFRFLKKAGIPVVWTLHDCTAFTGRCYHFTVSGCEKWKTQCGPCPCIHEFPSAAVDLTTLCHRKKRKWFTGVPDLTIVTPSVWLAGLVRQSYFQSYPVHVISSGIDLTVFRPTEGDFRQRFGIGKKKMLLFVANIWNEKKGLDTVIRFSEFSSSEYAIVVVGTDEAVEKRLPKDFIPIRRTNSVQELAEIYTAADLFVNPTLEDTYPTVNMEALACGTPVLTWEAGGSPEMLDESCGRIVPYLDEEALMRMAISMLHNNPCRREDCVKKAREFDCMKRFAQYAALYRQILTNKE